MTPTLAERYIDAKYKGATKEELIALRKDCVKELNAIEARRDEIFDTYTGVHGRFQHSQLDVLDIRMRNTCALFDNVQAMVMKAA